MSSGPAQAGSFEFGPFRLEIATRSLFRAGEFVHLPPKAAETLLALLEEAGRVVTKEQLLARVWPGVVVEEGGIANNVSALRKILDGDFGPDGPIATVARRGYRFTANVRRVDGAQPPRPLPPAPVAPGPRPREPEAEKPAATDRYTVLIADIENRTGEPVFDGSVKQALALQLAQSPFLDILADRKVHSVLALMQRQGEPVVGDVAHEICARTGTRVLIAGSIFALGDEYVIGLHALRGDDGESLVTVQARAKGRGEVLAALDQAARELRARLGESLASLQKYCARFDEVATSSLEALKAYATGRENQFTRGEAAALPYLERAIELDPNFVSAHTSVAIMFENVGQSARAAEHMQRAYALRDRATERERFRLTAIYHAIVTGDAHKAMDAYRSYQRAYPLDVMPLNNCASLYIILGQFEKAEADVRLAAEREISAVVTNNQAQVLFALGRPEEARATIEMAFSRGFDAYFTHADAFQEAFLRGDTAAMQRHVDAVAGRLGEEDTLIAMQAGAEAYRGRISRATELSRRAAESAMRGEMPELAATWMAEGALREALVGRFDQAAASAKAALAIANGRLVNALVGTTLALAGETARAEEIADAVDRENRQATIVQRYWLPCIRAAIWLSRSGWSEAVEALEDTATVELGLHPPLPCPTLAPVWLRAQAYLVGERWEDAAREFAKITTRPALVRNSVLFPLAHLGASKALAALGRDEEAGAMRARFLALFKDCDPELRQGLAAS